MIYAEKKTPKSISMTRKEEKQESTKKSDTESDGTRMNKFGLI